MFLPVLGSSSAASHCELLHGGMPWHSRGNFKVASILPYMSNDLINKRPSKEHHGDEQLNSGGR